MPFFIFIPFNLKIENFIIIENCLTLQQLLHQNRLYRFFLVKPTLLGFLLQSL